MALSTYDDLIADIKAKSGVSCYTMKTLRDVHGAGKLGTTVVENIRNELEGRGVGVVPDLYTEQWAEVRLYLKSTPVGKIIGAVMDLSVESDSTLRSFADAPQRSKTIERLKELIADL